MKEKLKYYTLDLLIMVLMLGLIVYGWNTLFYRMILIAEIGIKEAAILGGVFITFYNLTHVFTTSNKDFDKELTNKSGSMYRSKIRNILIFTWISVIYIFLYFLNIYL